MKNFIYLFCINSEVNQPNKTTNMSYINPFTPSNKFTTFWDFYPTGSGENIFIDGSLPHEILEVSEETENDLNKTINEETFYF